MRCRAMVNGSQEEIGEPSSNPCWDPYIHLRTYTLKKDISPALFPTAMKSVEGQAVYRKRKRHYSGKIFCLVISHEFKET